jgi:hypothetical protein
VPPCSWSQSVISLGVELDQAEGVAKRICKHGYRPLRRATDLMSQVPSARSNADSSVGWEAVSCPRIMPRVYHH